MRSALETLPWVEKGTIVPDTDKEQVRFAIKDKDKFDLEAVETVIKEKGFEVGKVISGP